MENLKHIAFIMDGNGRWAKKRNLPRHLGHKEGVENIYEATFNYQGILVMVDILHINNDGSVEIHEVKHSKEVRDVYINDAAIQYYVINGLGYKISKVTIIHRNDETNDTKNIFSK